MLTHKGCRLSCVGRTQRGVRGRRGRRAMPKRRPGMKKSPGGTLISTHVPAMGDAAVPMLMQVDSFSGLFHCSLHQKNLALLLDYSLYCKLLL